MVPLVQRRLQVFVSSTYDDLKDVRQAAVEAILSSGHIPAGMELFTAGDDSQMEVIEKWIDQSDVFLLILGGRYGSVHPKLKKSYTQLEFEYAAKMKGARFACVMTEECLHKRMKEHEHGPSYQETDNAPKLKKFRKSVTSSRVVSFWNDTNELKWAILKKLNELQRDSKLVGWIRADSIEATSPKVSEELARLSRENDELRRHVGEANSLIGGIPYEKLKEIIWTQEDLGTCLWEHKDKLLSGDYMIYADQPPEERKLINNLLELNLIDRVGRPDGGFCYRFNENGRIYVARTVVEFGDD